MTPADTPIYLQLWTNLLFNSIFALQRYGSYSESQDSYILTLFVLLESEQSTPPYHLISPKKTKPASPKSSTFSSPSLPSSPAQTPGATSDRFPAESKNSSKPSPSSTTSKPKASSRATRLPLNYRTGSSLQRMIT